MRRRVSEPEDEPKTPSIRASTDLRRLGWADGSSLDRTQIPITSSKPDDGQSTNPQSLIHEFAVAEVSFDDPGLSVASSDCSLRSLIAGFAEEANFDYRSSMEDAHVSKSLFS